MISMRVLDIPRPYLLLVGDITTGLDAKTALGLVEWRRDWCQGQLRFHPGAFDLGLPDLSCEQAAAQGIATMVIGGAPFGGGLPPSWHAAAVSALRAGLHVASGLHDRLNAKADLITLAQANQRTLFDIRDPLPGFVLQVASGRRRSGKRVLTVGTDCAIGKKFTALSLQRDMRARGINATFRATGQTGILISGSGIAIDAVVSDFVAGAAEQLSPDNQPDHWDVIEGQGSLFHPAYAAVSLGLLHGSQPDAFVVCHEATRTHVDGYPDYRLPALEECIALHIECGQRTNREIRCAGISLNTSGLPSERRIASIAALEQRLSLPCLDPALTSTNRLIDRLLASGIG
jgi:uncharacterized NAD-dependent epimerase/dehydratase family protein